MVSTVLVLLLTVCDDTISPPEIPVDVSPKTTPEGFTEACSLGCINS